MLPSTVISLSAAVLTIGQDADRTKLSQGGQQPDSPRKPQTHGRKPCRDEVSSQGNTAESVQRRTDSKSRDGQARLYDSKSADGQPRVDRLETTPRQTCALGSPPGPDGGPPKQCGRVTLFPILCQSLLSPFRPWTLVASESSSSASCAESASRASEYALQSDERP